jgi:tetratricopeptide (TPR) repeat protein
MVRKSVYRAIHLLDDKRCAGIVEQATARAWGALANAHRLQADFERADRALHRAAYHVAAAPDPLEEAWFYRLRARLRRDQGRLGRAVALQMQAVERLAATARPHLIAEALVELAALHLAAEDRPRTLAALLAAASALGEEADGASDCALSCAPEHR